MKIWYQSLFDAGRMPAYFDGVRKRVATVARPGTEVHLHACPKVSTAIGRRPRR